MYIDSDNTGTGSQESITAIVAGAYPSPPHQRSLPSDAVQGTKEINMKTLTIVLLVVVGLAVSSAWQAGLTPSPRSMDDECAFGHVSILCSH